MPPQVAQSQSAASGSSDEKGSTIWNLLPSFDPAEDDIREYTEKVKFIEGICPSKDKPMLAPRLAMLCKGTAWGQVKSIASAELVDPSKGVKRLLEALSSWEEASELKTFEQFEKAIYKVTQKNDEATNSFVNRLDVAFHDIGEDTTLKEVKAFIMLRQSSLSAEDKKKVISMVNGQLDTGKVEKAMRSLATRVLVGANEPRKKVYPINYVEIENEAMVSESSDVQYASANWTTTSPEDDDVDPETVDHFAQQGDQDAMVVQGFEKDLEEMVSYIEARSKLIEKRKHSGFWPVKGQGHKGGKKFGGKWRKGSGGKGGLLARIARTDCHICHKRGHCKAECPENPANKDSANVVQHFGSFDAHMEAHVTEEIGSSSSAHIIVEQLAPPGLSGFSKFEEEDPEQNIRQCPFVSHHHPISAPSVIHTGNKTRGDNHQGKKEDSLEDVLWTDSQVKDNIGHRMKQFWSHRFAARRMPHPSMNLTTSNPTKNAFAVCFSSDGSKDHRHQAILDTGASRSVIGQDIVPSMLKELPQHVRDSIKECPSRVGFRFGNNQIEYSFKQLQIPIQSTGKRIWLLIEVVPKATPFLLSIQTMKYLGAVIDLEKQTCYLKTLQRSLEMHESKNGLFLIRIQDLCQCQSEPTSSAVTFTCEAAVKSRVFARSKSIACDRNPAPLSDRHDAIPSRPSSTSEGSGRRDHGEPSFAVDGSHEPVRCSPFESGSVHGVHQPNVDAGWGSSESTSPDRRTDSPDATTYDDEQSRTQPRIPESARPRFRRRVGTSVSTSSWKCQHEDESEPNQSCQRSTSDSTPTSESSSGGHTSKDSEVHVTESNDGGTNIPSWKSWSPLKCDRDSTRFGQHIVGKLGKQTCQLGKETSSGQIQRCLRGGLSVPSLVASSGSHSHPGHDGLHCLLPDQGEHGAPCTGTRVNDRSLCVNSWEEIEWLLTVDGTKCKTFKRGITLLEVYADPNSRLREMVVKLGFKAERFTKEDGDLSTVEGQRKLLQLIHRLKPDHVWMAPECGPWGSWSRFNANRSLTGYHKIQKSREESIKHLKLCNVVMKMQVSESRHFHLENPVHSAIWDQKEIIDILTNTRTILFDQCRFGLRHPETQEPLKKGTRLQSTSVSMELRLNNKFCQGDHSHVPIAGSCRYQGQRMNLSRFCAFYPTILSIVTKPTHQKDWMNQWNQK